MVGSLRISRGVLAMLVAILFPGNAVATEPEPTPASGNSLESYYGSWIIWRHSLAGVSGTFYLGKDTIKYSDSDVAKDYKMVMRDNKRIAVIARSHNKNDAVYYFLTIDSIDFGGWAYKRECTSANIKKGSRGYALLQKNWDHISPDQTQKLIKASRCAIGEGLRDPRWNDFWLSVDIQRAKE